jgi:molybdate transport system substrate-binding protein
MVTIKLDNLMIIKIFFVLWMMGGEQGAIAAEIRVAVGANFSQPAKEIAAQFMALTKHQVKLSFNSTPKLYQKITNGANFDIMLAVDESYPEKLIHEGFATPENRFTYAIGKLVLWSATPDLVDNEGKVLFSQRFHNIAIANLNNAPYGLAAIDTLKTLGLFEKLQKRILSLEHTADVFQLTSAGGADLGFVALSQVLHHLAFNREYATDYWIVPSSHHRPLYHQAVLLKIAEKNQPAQEFFSFIKSEIAQEIIRRYGYDLP